MSASLNVVERLMLRGRIYEMLGIGFAYPEPAQEARLSELITGLSSFAYALGSQWSVAFLWLGKQAVKIPISAREAEFNRLFSGNMPCAPFETSFERDIFRKQQILADVGGFYRAFSLEVPPESRWQNDHLGVELEFCSHVLLRQATAEEQDLREQVASCHDAWKKFIVDHLGRWVEEFSRELDAHEAIPFYLELGHCVREWIQTEINAFGLEVDSVSPRASDKGDGELPGCDVLSSANMPDRQSGIGRRRLPIIDSSRRFM